MTLSFKKATKTQARAKMALIGPSGSGKTYSALAIAKHLGQRIALIDTENESASKYAHKFEFDTLNLETFSPKIYVEAIQAAEEAGYDVLIIDSLSHAWMGKDGALEQVNQAAARSKSNNSYVAWRNVTPLHNQLVDAMVRCKCHLIVTMRSKTEYVIEKDEKGRSFPRKVGLEPIQRDGLEYEFDVVADMDLDHNLVVSKTRCEDLDQVVINKPGKDIADRLQAWLSDGTPAVEKPKVQSVPNPPKKNEPPVEKPTVKTPPVNTNEATEQMQLIAILIDLATKKGFSKSKLDATVKNSEKLPGKERIEQLTCDELQKMIDYINVIGEAS